MALTATDAWKTVTSEAAEKTCRKPGRRDREAASLIQQRTRRQACLTRIYDPKEPLVLPMHADL